MDNEQFSGYLFDGTYREYLPNKILAEEIEKFICIYDIIDLKEENTDYTNSIKTGMSLMTV